MRVTEELIDKSLGNLLKEKRGDCLWPSPYGSDLEESAYQFLIDCCWTKDDTIKPPSNPIRLIPDKEYIRFLVHEWWETRAIGRPLVWEKCRRMIMSWILRGLDLWEAGLRQGTFYVACQKYEKSAEMIWRDLHLFRILREKKPDWYLDPPTFRSWAGPNCIAELILPNGSRFSPLTGEDPDSFRQEGATRVTCEEVAFWPRPNDAWSSAIVMCQAAGDQAVGGHPVAITTVDAKYGYLQMVAPEEAE